MNSNKLAHFMSIVLGPHVWFLVLLIVLLTKTGLTSGQMWTLLPVSLIFQILVPMIYLQWYLKSRKITAWDLPKREDRFLPLAATFVSYLISLVLIYIYGNQLIFNLNVIFLLLIATVSLITVFWKISLHTALNTAGALFINFLFGWQLPILYLLIPVIAWARYKLGRHNIKQLLAGTAVSGLIILVAFYYFGYTK